MTTKYFNFFKFPLCCFFLVIFIVAKYRISQNPLIDQTINDKSRYCSSWQCRIFMSMKAYDSKLDLFLEPTSTDIFSRTKAKMRSSNVRWFFCDFHHPSQSLHDAVASIQAQCLDAGSP